MKKMFTFLILASLMLLSVPKVSALQTEEVKARIAARQEGAREVGQVEQDSVASRCLSSQGRISVVRSRSEKSLGANTAQYARVKTYLESVTLVDKSIGTSVALSQAYNDTLAAYQKATATYLQELEDLVDMDCRANPAGFVITLEAARKSRKDIISAGQSLREQGLGPVTELLVKLARPLGGSDAR